MTAIQHLFHDGNELEIIWEDGSQSRLLAIWLRDHCQMASSRHPGSGQRLLNITDIPAGIGIEKASFTVDRLIIDFTLDGHHSEYDLDWLYDNCYCLNQQYDDRSEIDKIPWDAKSFEKSLPRCGYRAFCDDPSSQLAALRAVRDYGFVLLDNLPCEPGEVLKVIARFGFVRETNYGPLFEVKTTVDPSNLAFTNLGLGCHLDNPYRDPVPGLQLLHCLESSTAGGESVLQDGFMAARKLREENPEHFELLSQQWINFRFRDEHADLRARVPFIEVNDHNDVVKVRFNNRSIDTLLLPADIMAEFYPAYRHYAEILERPELQIVFKLQAGELILFDNTRILHARKAYSAAGKRHLQGAYSDLDGLYSSLRRLEKQLLKYQGIVFDKDGTLLDFNQTWLPIYRYAAREFAAGDSQMAEQLLTRHGFDLQGSRFIGGSLLAAGNNAQLAEAWSAQLGQADRVETFSLRLNRIFQEQGAIEATPVKNLALTLRQLKQSDHRLAVATADSYQGIINTLQSFEVLEEFDFLAGYDSGHGVKPEAGMVLAFCEKMSLDPSTVVVVGDNRHDIEMGRNARVGLCVGVLTGTSTRADLEQIADVVLDDISTLPDIL